MTARVSRGIGHLPAISAGVVRGLLQEKFLADDMIRQCTEFAPFCPVDLMVGQYPYQGGWVGFDAKRDALSQVSASFSATDYPQLDFETASRDFALDRYMVGERKISNHELALVQSVDGFDLELAIQKRFLQAAVSQHYERVWGQGTTASPGFSNTSAGYNSGANVRTDVTLGDTAYDLIAALVDVQESLMDTQLWIPGRPLKVGLAFGVERLLALNEQIRHSSTLGIPVGGIPTFSQIQGFFDVHLPGAKLHNIVGRAKNTSGTVVNTFDDKIVFSVVGSTLSDPGYMKVLTYQQDGNAAIFDLRSEVNQAIGGGGTNWYADALLDIHLGTPNVAVLWSGVSAAS